MAGHVAGHYYVARTFVVVYVSFRVLYALLLLIVCVVEIAMSVRPVKLVVIRVKLL